MVKFVAIALLSAAMLPSVQADFSCTSGIWNPGPNSPFLKATAADADALNALDFAKAAMDKAILAGAVYKGLPLFTMTNPAGFQPPDSSTKSGVSQEDVLFVDTRICDFGCVRVGMNLVINKWLTGDEFPGWFNVITYPEYRIITGGMIQGTLPGRFIFPQPPQGNTDGSEDCEKFAATLNEVVMGLPCRDVANGAGCPVSEEKGKKGKKNKKGKSPKEPKSSKEPKSPKGSKGPKKGKTAALAAKQSQAAKLEVGAGVALVAMVGFVALVATKLGPSVAAEDETALLAVAAEASPDMA